MATPVRPHIERDDAPAAPAAKSSRRRFLMPLAIILGVFALVWGVKQFLYARAHESTDDAQVDGHIIPVLAKVGGYVDAVYTDENQHLKSGAIAVRIDSSEYQVKVAQAQADLAAAQAAVGSKGLTGQALAQVLTAQSQSAATDAQIAAAKANYDKAKADLSRLQALVDKQIVSAQQLDAAQAQADAAQAALLGAQKQSAAGLAGISTAEAGVRLAAARLASAKAVLDNAELQLSYTAVRAPGTGLVARKQIEVGQLVQPGQTLFTLVTDTTFITANLKETQLDHIRVGQAVDFDVDAYGGATAHGVVESLAGATGAKFALLPPDNATGNFTKVVQRVPIRVRVTQDLGPDRPLRPGMSVEVHVATK